jgi:hypothetical protein
MHSTGTERRLIQVILDTRSASALMTTRNIRGTRTYAVRDNRPVLIHATNLPMAPVTTGG